MGIKKGNILFRLLLLVYLGAVAFLCFANFHDMPETEKTLLGIPMDKVVHFCMFFPFPFIVYLTLAPRRRKPWLKILLASGVLLSGLAVAALTEIVQSHLDYRSGDVMDFAADTLALFIGTVAVLAVDLTRKR